MMQRQFNRLYSRMLRAAWSLPTQIQGDQLIGRWWRWYNRIEGRA